MLGKDNQSTVLLSECRRHESGILIEVPNSSFISSVEEDGLGLGAFFT